eukprot:15017595-Heterocapsa_arctica.AAC.1
MAQPESAPTQPNSVEEMACALTRVISDMHKSSYVPQQYVAETELHMRNLMEGVRNIAAAAAYPGPAQSVA